MKKNNANTLPTVATKWWQVVIPQFQDQGTVAYFAREKREFILWRANRNCFHREDGTVYWTYYPLTQDDWENSFGCWLDANVVDDSFTRDDVYPEPDRADVYMYWLEFLEEEPERAIHYSRCKAAYEEAQYDLD